jgi:hypothetical protein
VTCKVFISNPMRCGQCLRLGHHRDACRSKPACRSCGHEKAAGQTCPLTPCCVNCAAPHSPFAKDCFAWLRERRVPFTLTIKTFSNTAPSRALSQSEPTCSWRSTPSQTVFPSHFPRSQPTFGPSLVPPLLSTFPPSPNPRPLLPNTDNSSRSWPTCTLGRQRTSLMGREGRE